MTCNLKSYHAKSDAELLYILRDAAEAAVNMRGLDPVAECKYLDQVNDACTVMHMRRSRRDRDGRGPTAMWG
jgi:hypothetical protein